MERTATLNQGDEALTTGVGAMARLLAQHMDNGDQFIADLRELWHQLARLTPEGAVGRNVYIALADALPRP